jgi:hypothetical protein
MHEAQDQAHEDVMAFAKSLQHSLFATRETVEDAFAYAYEIIESLPQQDKVGAYTAVHVLMNTIAEEIKRKAEWR